MIRKYVTSLRISFSIWFLIFLLLFHFGTLSPKLAFQVTDPGIFMLGCGGSDHFLVMDFAFVPDQMFCFSLVTVCIVVSYYTAVLWNWCQDSPSISQELCWINETAGSIPGEGTFFTFLIHAVSASSDPWCHEWFFLVTGENKKSFVFPIQ